VKTYYATRAITDAIGWATFLLLLALLHDDLAEWSLLFVGMSVWFGITTSRNLRSLRDECEAWKP
jgi:D-alanyl-lipoteichoic acid acyltransferase DltB (MBOAT superfamily)